MAELNRLKYEAFEHPLYPPDLAPSDYFLFRNLKQIVREKLFLSIERTIRIVEGYNIVGEIILNIKN